MEDLCGGADELGARGEQPWMDYAARAPASWRGVVPSMGGLNPWRRRPCAAAEEGVPSARGHNSRQRRCGGGAAERVVEEGAPSACRGGREVAAGSLGGDGRWERERGRRRRGGEWSRGEEGLGFPVAGGAE